MISTIIYAVIIGAIVGALARLVLPGRQNISILMTIVLGILGSAIGTWLTYQFGYSNRSGFEWIPFLVGIAIAAALIVAYGAITGKDRTVQRM